MQQHWLEDEHDETAEQAAPTTGCPVLDDVAVELDGGWSAEQVEAAYLAEKAAQASVCNLPEGDWPEDLQRALHRRVLVNLQNGTGSRVGGSDPEVRDLEEPYSKRVAGQAVAH